MFFFVVRTMFYLPLSLFIFISPLLKNSRMRRENIKIEVEGIKKFKRENNKIVEEETKKIEDGK